MEVPLRWVERLGSVRRVARRAGDAKWATHLEADKKTLMFVCPCGCGDVISVAVCPPPAPAAAAGRPCWAWNGSIERPTLTPSIQYTAGCRWHGWLVDGVFRSA